jgi:hypothetical protein
METRCLNLGAGVQSSAIYVMGVQGKVEFDFAVFSDTGEEPPHVHEMVEWLQSLDGPPIHIVSKGTRLGDALIKGVGPTRRFASIPAFTARKRGTKEGMVPRQCTAEFKIEVIEEFVKREVWGIPKNGRCGDNMLVQLFGFSREQKELRRAARTQGRFGDIYWAKAEFPLIADKDQNNWISRHRCREILIEAGCPFEPEGSECVFCPFKDNERWKEVRKCKESWDRACEVDDALRNGARAAEGLNHDLYVHFSCVPLREVDLDAQGMLFNDAAHGFSRECEGGCGL